LSLLAPAAVDAPREAAGAPDYFRSRATREHPGHVLHGWLGQEQLRDLEARADLRKSPPRLPRSQANRELLDTWVELLGPHFDGCAAASVTLTYSNEYGYAHGCMLARNVRTDFLRALAHERPDGFTPWCLGIEHHNTGRDILHAHAMLGGDWSATDMQRFSNYWESDRGWCRIEPVTAAGGCVQYCAKHLLKRGAADNFDFRVRPFREGSRAARRGQIG